MAKFSRGQIFPDFWVLIMTKYYKKWRTFLAESESAYEKLPADLKSKVDAEKDTYRASYALSADPFGLMPHGASAQVWLQDIKDRNPEFSDDQAVEYYSQNILPTLEPAIADEPHFKSALSRGRSAKNTGVQSVASYATPTHADESGTVFMGFEDQPEAGLERYDDGGSTYQGVLGHEMAHAIDFELGGDSERPPDVVDINPRSVRGHSDDEHGHSTQRASNAVRQLPKFEQAFPGITAMQSQPSAEHEHWQDVGEPYADIIKLRAKLNTQWLQGERESPLLTPDDLQNIERSRHYYGHPGWMGGDLRDLIINMRNPNLNDQEIVDILNSIAVADSPEAPVVVEKRIFSKWRKFLSEEREDDMDSKKIAKIVLYDGNKVLLLKRSPHLKKYPGEWDLPGGHLIVGEEVMTGLQREVWEETGLTIRSPEKLYSQSRYTYFKAQIPTGGVKLSQEHTNYKLIDMANLDKYDLPKEYADAVRRAFN